MQRLALLACPLLMFSPPALSADLDGHRERDVVIERAPPRVVERTRIIERHHYHQAPPVYIEPRAYYAPRVYEETYYDRPYASLCLRGSGAPALLRGHYRCTGITTSRGGKHPTAHEPSEPAS